MRIGECCRYSSIRCGQFASLGEEDERGIRMELGFGRLFGLGFAIFLMWVTIMVLDYYNDWCVRCRYFRPSEVDNLRGSARKAKAVLGWEPKVNFKQLVAMMVEADLEKAKREKVLVDAGFMDSHQQP